MSCADWSDGRKDIHAGTNLIQNVIPFEFTSYIPTCPNHFQILRLSSADKQTFGQYLKKRRLEHNLLAKDLARKLGCHKDTIWRWEGDLETPRLRSLRKLHKMIHFSDSILKEVFIQTHPQISPYKEYLFNLEAIKTRLLGIFSGSRIFDPGFSNIFLIWRLSHLMTVSEFAHKLGFDPCSIMSWERGEHMPQLSTMVTLKRILAGPMSI
jgi:transcriptional regulator with XRE-family HTH domain